MVTSVRLNADQRKRLDELAEKLNMPKNRIIGTLIMQAEIESRPVISVGALNANRHAEGLGNQRSMAIEA